MTPVQSLINQCRGYLAGAGLPCHGAAIREALGEPWAATRHSHYVHGHREPTMATLRDAMAAWRARYPKWPVSVEVAL